MNLVLVMEAREKNRTAVEEFKLAMVSADPLRYIPMVYPEWMVKSDDEITTKDLQESEGEWTFEQDMSQEEIEQVLADLRAQNIVTLTGDDLVGEGPEIDLGPDWDEE